MRAETLTDLGCKLAEGPLWHTDERRIYFTDIEAGRLHTYDPETQRTETVWEGPRLGGMTIQADGSLLLFLDRGEIRHWRAGVEKVLVPEIEAELQTRFNDVAADPEGRVFCGLMSPPDRLGHLYRLDLDGSLTLILEGVGCSNGIGFSPDTRTMYFTDTMQGRIDAFGYDRSTGEITNRRPFYPYTGAGAPDGMTVDSNGDIWTAIWGGACVVHVDSTGHEVERFPVDAQKVTCPNFGGPNFDQLYVTTAGGDTKAQDGPASGELLRLDVGASGKPEFRSRIRI